MRFVLCLAVVFLFCACGAQAESYATSLLWTSKSVLGQNSETSVAYETVHFADLWNAVLGQFAKGDAVPNGFFPPTQDTADVFVVFLSNNHELWQFSGDTSVSEPLRTAFKGADSKQVFNNIRVDDGDVTSLVIHSLKEAGVDSSFVGSCPGVVGQSVESGFDALFKKEEGSTNTKVVVICGDGTLSHEMDLVGRVNTHLKESGVEYVMMFVTQLDESISRSEYSNAQRRRTLKQVEAEEKLPIDYSTCDDLCRTRVKFLEGIVLSLILALALTAGLCCMNILDTPTQFEKPEDGES